MPENEPTAGEIYRQLLQHLRDVGAENVAEEIERTVARGVVLQNQPTPLYDKSSVFRPMDDVEALTVAVGFVVTSLEVPLMLARTHEILGTQPVKWVPERPGAEREEISIDPIGRTDAAEIDRARSLLIDIIKMLTDLRMRLPEVA